MKNRNREEYTFANINLLGKCNADCYFCLGKDIPELLNIHDQRNTHFGGWGNFERFLDLCSLYQIRKIYVTGQNVDSLQYEYLFELVHYLQGRGFVVGLRTNGYQAKKNMCAIQACKDEIGYSINSLTPSTNKTIMKRQDIPDWENIIADSGDNVRVAVVVNRYNHGEFLDIVRFVSQFKNVRYVQARRISTDTRKKELQQDIDVYEELFGFIDSKYRKTGEFYLAQQYEIEGVEVDFWRTVATSVNSINYFTDGTISDNYFVIEGYLQNYKECGAEIAL